MNTRTVAGALKYTAEFKYGARGGRAMACLARACAVLGALGGTVPAPRAQRGAVRPNGTRWPPLQARGRSENGAGEPGRPLPDHHVPRT